MPILYSLISRGTCILAEYQAENIGGNFVNITQVLLGRIQENANETRMTYILDQYLFHYIISHGITFLCMADSEAQRRVPFMFLEDIIQRFEATFGSAGQTAIAYSLNPAFAPVLKRQLAYFNQAESDSIVRIKNQIDEVKDIMMLNIDNVLERGEKLELLVEKSDNLQQESFRFRKEATRLQRSQMWKKLKAIIFLVVIMLCISYFVSATICGLDLKSCS